ncbi:MAG: TRAP transporter small permease [Alphaproteobacteria bacterium]
MLNSMEGVTPKGEGGLLGVVDRAVSKVENAFNAIAAIFVVIVMVYMCAEVLSRKFFDRPLPGVIDWIELLMATFAFLGAAYCQRLGSHVRMEILVGRLRGRILWAMEALAVSVALFYISVVAYKSYTESFMWAYELGDSTMDIYLPVWPSKLIVPVALGLLSIRLAINLWGYLRMFFAPEATPYAVPLIKDVADVARHEIEEAMGHDAKSLRNDDR